MKTALITGVTGQDGSYLAELLLSKGYAVHGLVRRSSVDTRERIAHLLRADGLRLHEGDLTDGLGLARLIRALRPHEIYNLAAQSDVAVSFDTPEYTANADGLGVLRLLEAVHLAGLTASCRFYQASTSELFGKAEEVPQRETTPFHPRSPYAVAKLYAYWMVRHHREAYGLFASNGILFNHESPRRGENFVTRKITLAAGRIAEGLQDCLYLGNLNAKRDWGAAQDYAECMGRILRHPVADDFVVATGETHTVREFATLAFAHVDLPLRWEGEGLNEVGIEERTGRVLVRVDPAFFRPAEVDLLLGDPAKARRELGWNPCQTAFEDLVRAMAESDWMLAKRERQAR